MDYARFNYVAQPGDGDVAMNPEGRPLRQVLDQLGLPADPRRQDTRRREADARRVDRRSTKAIRCTASATRRAPIPGSQTEDLGDDGVKASEYGIANLKRIMPKLLEWTYEQGADYSPAARRCTVRSAPVEPVHGPRADHRRRHRLDPQERRPDRARPTRRSRGEAAGGGEVPHRAGAQRRRPG